MNCTVNNLHLYLRMLKFPIYLDNHSTTKTDPRVVEAMLPYFTEIYGNASSKTSEFGHQAEVAVENARSQVAKIINAESREIIFTSGATESINLAHKGIAEAYKDKGNHIITVKTEHKAVLDTCEYLETKGYKVTYLNVDKYGCINLKELEKSITKKTILVSIMFANNEIGTIHPVEEIGKICRKKDVLFHCDAVQAVGKIPIDVKKYNIDLLSMSAHKFHGPKGIGALYINSKIKLNEQMHGGGQEKKVRAGTLNVPAIVGLGKACEIAIKEMIADSKRIKKLRDKFQNELKVNLKEIYFNGHPKNKLCTNLNFSIKGVDAESCIILLRGIYMSTGSACTSDSLQSSHVLVAIDIPDKLRKNTIRLGFSKYTTELEIVYAVKKLTEAINILRKL